MKKLTILMPTYNEESYIGEALDSILMQRVNFDFQIIIIDDKSTDRSLEIAKAYQAAHPDKIRIIESQANEGAGNAILKGCEQTKTEYFCVLDADDYWLGQNKLQKAIDFLDTHPDFTMYMSNTYVDDGKTKTPYLSIMKSIDVSFENVHQSELSHTTATIFRNVIFKYGVPVFLYERQRIKSTGTIDSDIFRNLLHLKHGKAHVVPDIESVYRFTGDGIWTRYNTFQRNTLHVKFYLDMFLYFDKKYPDYFIGQARIYCKKNFELMKQKTNYAIEEKDILDFNESFTEYLKYKKYLSFAANCKYFIKSVVRFVLPDFLYQLLSCWKRLIF
jgi:glycosyltransferase involved in cell wall biosynthesis